MIGRPIAASLLGMVAGLSVALAAGHAGARDLKIGLSADVTSIDPHFYNATPNNTIALQIFEPLVRKDIKGELLPALAQSWKLLSDTEWEFKLRRNVKWHDGTPFTAADVAFSLERLKSVPGAPGGFSSQINTIAQVEVVDDATLRVVTSKPTPNLPMSLTVIAIIPKATAGSTPEDYNAGRATIGTGPYKFVRYIAGDRIELARNEGWWDGQADWDKVSVRIVPNLAVRTTSLLSGDLDIIESPAATDLKRLESEAGIRLASVPGDRVAYINPILIPGEGGERVSDAAGKPIEPTPLQNPKVRKALSLAINRSGLCERIMLGTCSPTGQIMAAGVYSYAPDIKIPVYDPQAAKALLAEAGFPNGFSFALTAANDRVPYNVEAAQAIAQMWSRIGVRTTVNGIPTSVYARLASAQQISAYLGSWGNSSMEAGTTFMALLHSYDKARSAGTYNWSRYANPAFDQALAQAVSTMDPGRREGLLQDATRIALNETAIIPLYHFKNTWAMRRSFSYEPRADGLTLAQDIRAAKQP